MFENSPYEFSINLSVNDILDNQTVSYIKETLERSRASERVVFELLESEGIENYTEVIAFITDVKRHGAKIAVDDFGTGYSNFEYLMEMKVDYIKIDAAMIKNINRAKNSEIVTETIVDFAKKLGIKTIAEFVHSQEVFEKVRDIGVDYSQGYHFGKPESTLKRTI
jgi:EAL domain-containing protein (putative c-di-GMP-specific phosphodiesterase class I)